MAHLWHGISTGANPPLDINVIIEILEFFRVYKNLEEKKVLIQGVEPLEVAIEIVHQSLKNYKEKYLETK